MPPQEVLVCAKPSVARRVAGVLRSRGYAVETAGDGVRAVEDAERQNPDVVLIWSDLRGPDTVAVVRRVQEASGAKVAVIVRREAAGRAAALRDAGADAVLADGRNIDRLARVVDRLLEGGLVEDALDLPGDETFEAEAAIPNGNGRLEDEPPDPTAQTDANETAQPAEPGIDFQPLDVAEIVQDGAAQAARGFPAVVVQVTAPPRLPAVGHPDALRGAVRAVVEEACRDSEAGSDVAVKAQRVDAGIFVLVADRGPDPGREEPDRPAGPPSGATLARALVALHGGILSVEPIPAGGRRASFTIPERPPHLTGVELQGGLRALELLEQAEALWRGEPPPTEPGSEDEGARLEQAIAQAAADAAAHAPERTREPEGLADPIRSLAELFGFAAPEEAPAPDEVMDVELEVEPEPQVADAVDASAEIQPELEAMFEPEEVREADEAEETPPGEVVANLEALFDVVPDDVVRDIEPEDVEADQPEAVEPEPVELELSEPEPELEPEPEEPAAVITLPPHEEEPAVEPLPESIPAVEAEPVDVPEPVPAVEAAAPEPTPAVLPPKNFVPDPLHPATAILRALAEEWDTESNRFRGR